MQPNKRIQGREGCFAKAFFTKEAIPGYLRDLSPKGFRIGILQKVQWTKGHETTISLIPHEDVNATPFQALVEVRWIRPEGIFTVIGFQIIRLIDDNDSYNKLLHFYENIPEI